MFLQKARVRYPCSTAGTGLLAWAESGEQGHRHVPMQRVLKPGSHQTVSGDKVKASHPPPGSLQLGKGSRKGSSRVGDSQLWQWCLKSCSCCRATARLRQSGRLQLRQAGGWAQAKSGSQPWPAKTESLPGPAQGRACTLPVPHVLELDPVTVAGTRHVCKRLAKEIIDS